MPNYLNEDIAKLAAMTTARLIHSGTPRDAAVRETFAKIGVLPDEKLLWSLTHHYGSGKPEPGAPGEHWIDLGFFGGKHAIRKEDVDSTLADEHNSIYTLDGTNYPSNTMENKRLVTNMSNDERLDNLQNTVKDLLRETKTKFGNPVNVSLPSGENIVYRRRQYEGRPDPVSYEVSRSDSRKAQHKRSQAQVEAWNKLATPRKKSLVDSSANPKRMKLMASNDSYELNLMEKFPLAYELVEYVQGGGASSNVSRMLQLKPPVIYNIEDIADSIDWQLLNKGINSEHIETALNKEGTNVLLFMDDRAKPQLPQIKEILNKFGEPRILQKADDIAETTGQPHGFYVFELVPDTGLYQRREGDKQSAANDWEKDVEQRGANESVDIDEVYDFLTESIEPYCSTCGEEMFETGDPRHAFKPSSRLGDRKFQAGQHRKKSTSAWKLKSFSASQDDEDNDFTEVDETDSQSEMRAKVQFGKKAKKLDKKGHTVASGTGTTYNMDSLECQNCGTAATELDEHEFKGYYCARHGNRLDKYSRACTPCQESTERAKNTIIACPDCHSKVTLEDANCGVCGTVFMEDEVTDYAGYLADRLVPYEEDDEIVEMDHNWDIDDVEPCLAETLANTLFADVENEIPFV